MNGPVVKLLAFQSATKEEAEVQLICKFVYEKSLYTFTLSNLNQMWQQKLNDDEIKKTCKVLNPRLDAPASSIISHIQRSLSEYQNSSGELQLKYCDGKLNFVTLQNKFKSVPFTWKFNLEELSPSSTLECIISPLYVTISALLVEKNELTEIIKRKDEEIKDYKESGAKVTRSYLETDEHNSSDFEQEWRNTYAYASLITKPAILLAADENLNTAINNVTKDAINEDLINLAQNISKPSPQKIAKYSPQKTKRAARKTKRQLPVVGVKLESSDSDTDIEKDADKQFVEVNNATKNRSRKQNVKSKKKSIF